MFTFVGFLLPPLIDLINRRISNEDARFWVSVAVCSLIGLVINVVERNGLAGYSGLTLVEIAGTLGASVMTVFGTAQITYKAVYEDSNMQKSIRKE